MKKIAVINFTGFRGNWGCQATSFELLKFVAGLYPDDEPLAFTCVPLLPSSRADAHYETKLDQVFESFTAVASQTDCATSALAFLEEAAKRRYGFWAEAVRQADLVVFQAEGSMGLGTGYARGPRLMLLPFVAKHAWGRRVISLNQSFYSHDERIVQNAVETFSTLDFAGFREGASVAFARESGVANAAYVPDLAFMTCSDTSRSGAVSGGAPSRFAVSGSALKDPDRYRHILAQTKAIMATTGLRPLIAVSRDVKLTALSVLRLPFGGYDRLRRSASYVDVARDIAECAFLLGGRYHMAILGAAVATPSIFLPGNSFKNEGLAHLLASPRPVRQFDDGDGIVEDAVALLEGGTEERRRTATQVTQIRAVISLAQDHLRNLVNGAAVGVFDDGLEPFPFDRALLETYRRYGRGKTTRRRLVLPGALLGHTTRPDEIVPPLVAAAMQGSPSAVALLRRMAAGDDAVRRYLSQRAPEVLAQSVEGPNVVSNTAVRREAIAARPRDWWMFR